MVFHKRLIVILFVLLALIVGFAIGKISLTGEVVKEQVDKRYTWTTAICDYENKCLDVLISCDNGNVVGITPVSDYITHNTSWQDPRINLSKEYCE